MGLNYYASAPTLVLPPPQPSHHLANPINNVQPPPFARSSSRTRSFRKHPRPPSLNYMATEPKAAGQKRRIDDVEDAHENDAAGAYAPPPKPKVEPIYGPGMTLIYPDDPGFCIAAESQTGTWAEDKHEVAEKEAARPIMKSRKSQRRDSAENDPVQISSNVATAPAVGGPVMDLQLPSRAMALLDNCHTVDQLRMALGVGWKQVIESVARAYEKLINKHYSMISDSLVLLENHGDFLNGAVLVRAVCDDTEAYFAFDEKLRTCQVLGTALQDFVPVLRDGKLPAGIQFTWEEAPESPQTSPHTVPVADIDMEATSIAPLPMTNSSLNGHAELHTTAVEADAMEL